MDWVRLESSVIRAVRYFEQKRLLYLEFSSGAIYRYFEFPPQHYSDFLAADSHGRYFNQHILDRFREEIVRPPRPK
jgi:KTSC domain